MDSQQQEIKKLLKNNGDLMRQVSLEDFIAYGV